ncbi:MAG TPA: PAS domain-containing protein, partial [Bacteroidia bacterium]|nr:PAS domain-containing protein [Bacteroidia bacterium]
MLFQKAHQQQLFLPIMPQKGRPIRILVVENNSKDFKLLQKSLTTAAIKRAETVDQAVETLADQNFDLIFLHLPVADNSGLQAFEKLRNKSGNTSVIICCDKNNLELARQMIHEGAQEYVLKEKIDQDTLSRIVYCSMERAQYHERIRKSEEFYRGGSDAEQKRTAEKLHFQSAVLENITDGVFITDADNKVVFWNKACVEIFGYPENEMIGKEPSVLSVDSNDGTDMSNIVRRMDTYGSFNAVVRRRTNEGRIIWIDLKVTYNYDADRTKTGMIFVTRDVTDIQDEEHLLKLFQSVILNTNDAVVIIDATSSPKEAAQKIVFVNEAFRQTTGYRPDEIIGKTLFTLSGPLTDEKEMRRIHEAMLRWESFEGELLYYRKDSSTFWVNITLMPVSDQSGRFTHWVFILRNITEEKNADEQLRDQNDALTKTNRELDRFVYSASHDLRAPLTSVLGLVSLMRRESFGEDAGIYLDKIHESIHRLDRLIQN